jgi:septal ring factor EnvC (AmiA/AmiB activator)
MAFHATSFTIRIAGLAVVCGVGLLLLVVHTFAQTDDLGEKRDATTQELQLLQDKMSLTEARKAELDKEILALEQDRATINRNLIEASTRARDLENRIGRSAERLQELRDDEGNIKTSLNERRALLTEIIAALQRMGRNPPPALLVTPQDALASVRSAILLGAVVPEVKAETEILVTELNELVRVRQDIDANRASLEVDLRGLAEEEQRLSTLLAEKKKSSNLARSELTRQTALAAELAGRAGNLQSLIEQLETQIASVREAAEAARIAEEQQRLEEEQRVANAREEIEKPDFSNTSRIAPAMAFDQAKGLLPRPVSGVELASFNQKMPTGELSQGLSVVTRNGSRVVSPTDGWVIYAGPFRSYGHLLIVNAGGGYHVVLAGMDRIDAVLGQFVLAGEPVGAMATTRIASATNVDIGSQRPVLYVEFRKDGKSIDPSPWWARNSSEERNG